MTLDDDAYDFPGRWVGGGSLIFGPLLLLMGVGLRIPELFSFTPAELQELQAHPTFFPLQLAAFEVNPRLVMASYGAFLAGNILMCPAIIMLVGIIGRRARSWATWGGTLAILGLFSRAFHAGVDHFAFQLVRVQDLELATRAVGDAYAEISYGPFNMVAALGFAVMFGWVLLAVGAYRSGTLGKVRAVALGLTAMLFLGVLKGGTLPYLIEVAGLCIALVPLGVRLLRGVGEPEHAAATS